MISTKPFAVALLLTPTALACNHTQHGRMKGSAEARAESETHSAVKSIAAARCDREVRCGHVGQGEKYDSYSTCQENVRGDWGSELNAYECPRGVSESKLGKCLDSVRDEECGKAIQALSTYVTCRSSDICLD